MDRWMSKMNEEKLINDVFLTLKNYILESGENSEVKKNINRQDLRKILPEIEDQEISQEKVIEELKTILDSSVRTIHPLFLNQLFGGADPVALAGEMASTVLNPTMATFEMAPALTIIEKRMVKALLERLNIETGEGIMVTGGSNSNLLAILCARTDFNPSIRLTGFPYNNLRIYVSAEAHYSFDKAANISGIGTQNLVQIPCNEKGEMIPEELERTIKSDIKEGMRPLMVGASAGTTVLGAFDPLAKIAKICSKYKIWFHVDAAWGGGALFDSEARELLRGIEKADSVTFDAHKVLGVPLVTSFFLTPHTGILRETNRGGGSEYLFHDFENGEWDTGTYSLQCGRRADALKLWLLWRFYGSKGLEKRTKLLFGLANFAKEEINHRPKFKLFHSNYLNVCFQVTSQKMDSNEFTLRVREALIEGGKAMVNYAKRPDGTIFFRLVFPNHRTTKDDLVRLFDILEEVIDQVDSDLSQSISVH
jgi:glutamate/tyrosine decarboxylase-like PLP-dependent enzyme